MTEETSVADMAQVIGTPVADKMLGRVQQLKMFGKTDLVLSQKYECLCRFSDTCFLY